MTYIATVGGSILLANLNLEVIHKAGSGCDLVGAREKLAIATGITADERSVIALLDVRGAFILEGTKMAEGMAIS